MTHVLIPLKEFEEFKELNKEWLKQGNTERYFGLNDAASYFKLIGKQIDLSKEAINIRSSFHKDSYPAAFSDYTYETGVEFGYKQALKDIL